MIFFELMLIYLNCTVVFVLIALLFVVAGELSMVGPHRKRTAASAKAEKVPLKIARNLIPSFLADPPEAPSHAQPHRGRGRVKGGRGGKGKTNPVRPSSPPPAAAPPEEVRLEEPVSHSPLPEDEPVSHSPLPEDEPVSHSPVREDVTMSHFPVHEDEMMSHSPVPEDEMMSHSPVPGDDDEEDDGLIAVLEGHTVGIMP